MYSQSVTLGPKIVCVDRRGSVVQWVLFPLLRDPWTQVEAQTAIRDPAHNLLRRLRVLLLKDFLCTLRIVSVGTFFSSISLSLLTLHNIFQVANTCCVSLVSSVDICDLRTSTSRHLTVTTVVTS